jgi:hypothetical protein
MNGLPSTPAALTGVLGPKMRLRILHFGRRHVFRVRHRGKHRMHGNDSGPYAGKLQYHGGPVQTAPVAYVVFWGFENATDTAHDPYGMASYLTAFLQSISASSWVATVTQYYQTNGGPATYIDNVASIFGGVSYDPVPPPHKTFTDAQAAQEALKVAAAAGYSMDVNYIVVTPHTYTIDGFGSDFCGYHSSVSTPRGPLTYTVLPYIPDASDTCGQGSVDVPGTLDGVTIVGGHEVTETATDPIVGLGWMDGNGHEIADKCEWFDLQSTTFANGSSYPTQPLWSNASSSCVQSYATTTPTPTPVGTPTPNVTPTPIVTPTPQPTASPLPANIVKNAGFERGRLKPWHTCRSSDKLPDSSIRSDSPHAGQYDAYAGTRDGDDTKGYTAVCQLVTLRPGAHLTVWTRGVSHDFSHGAYQFGRLYTSSGEIAKTLYKVDRNEKKWHEWDFDLSHYANRQFYLSFGVEEKSNPRKRYIGQYVDDVTLSP